MSATFINYILHENVGYSCELLLNLRLAAENERASSVLESNKNAERSETGGGETQSILPPSVQILPHINNTIEGKFNNI